MIGRQRHSRHFNCPSRHMQMTQHAPPRRGRRDSRSRNRTLLHNIAGALGRPGSSFLLNKPHTGPRARTTHQGHSRSATSPWRLGLTPCYRCAMPWAPLRPAAGQGGGCEKKGRWVSEGWEFGFKRLSSLSLPVCYFSLPGLLWLCAFLPLRSELCRIFKLRRLFHPGVLTLDPPTVLSPVCGLPPDHADCSPSPSLPTSRLGRENDTTPAHGIVDTTKNQNRELRPNHLQACRPWLDQRHPARSTCRASRGRPWWRDAIVTSRSCGMAPSSLIAPRARRTGCWRRIMHQVRPP